MNIRFLYLASLLILSVILSSSCTDSPPQKAAIATVASDNRDKELESPKMNKIEIDTSIKLAYIMGKFDPKKDERFVQIPTQYANGRNDRLLRKEAYEAFLKMYKAAKQDSIQLTILSATRNFDIQKIIWEGKWTGTRLHEGKENLAETTPDKTQRALKILKWSSMPGTSRHHWGTDIDLNDLENVYFESGYGLKVYEWLVANAPKYGFCQPYSPKGEGGRPFGYNEEKWHWSYLPIALPLTQQARLRLKDEMIEGFKGAETAKEIKVVERFILGISPICL